MAQDQHTDAAVAAALERAAAGSGQVLVVVGERGAGRTRYALEGAARARSSGLRVLDVHTGGAAVGVPFEMIAELFGELAALPAEDALFAGAAADAWPLVTGRAVVGSPEERNRTIHAVHWLVRRLADRQPLALVVDDLDVADEASVRCLEYLATRSGSLPVLVLVTVTSQAQERPAEIRASLSALPGATVVRLRALGAADLPPLLNERGMPQSDPVFREACVRLTGGNPGLLVQLLDEIAGLGIPPRAASVPLLDDLAAPTSTIRTIGARLRRLRPQAAAVADAVQVLGDDATVARVARVAEVAEDDVRAAADGLAAAALLTASDPPRLRCPMVERALAAAPGTSRRSEMRSRAAELLRNDGVPLQRVAALVHAAEPRSAPGATETLTAAARAQLAAGRLDAAERHLRRALDESLTETMQHDVRLQLTCVQVALDRDGAAERFEAALGDCPPGDRARRLHRLAETLLAGGRRRRAATAFRGAIAALEGVPGSGPLRADLDAAFVAVARDLPGVAGEARRVLARYLEAAMPAPMAVTAALDAAFAGRPRAEVVVRARAALDAILRDGAAPQEAARCVHVLLYCDELDAACDASRRLLANRIADAAALEPARAWRELICGRPAEALAAARGHVYGPDAGAVAAPAATLAATVTAFASMELGDLDGAAAALHGAAGLGEPEREERGLDVHLLDARGWLQLRAGDATSARKTFLRALELARSAAMDNPAVVRSWFGAARALQRLGRVDEARDIATEALTRAQAFGAPRAEAAALECAAGVAASRADGVAMLERSLLALEGLDAPLDRARVLLALGAALSRDNRRAPAREVLREAMDLAHRANATALQARALDELRAAGARPRRAQLHGVESLTPAERQVAEHAGRGLSNRDIAAMLYVTPKTVEWHLRNVFLKLGVGDRQQLDAALGGEPAPVTRPPAGDHRR